VESVAWSAYSCKRRARERWKEGESIAQWQQEKGRDWWNVKFSSAEETGLALLPVIGLAPFPKSKPTTLYCHFLFLSLCLLLSLSLSHSHSHTHTPIPHSIDRVPCCTLSSLSSFSLSVSW